MLLFPPTALPPSQQLMHYDADVAQKFPHSPTQLSPAPTYTQKPSSPKSASQQQQLQQEQQQQQQQQQRGPPSPASSHSSTKSDASKQNTSRTDQQPGYVSTTRHSASVNVAPQQYPQGGGQQHRTSPPHSPGSYTSQDYSHSQQSRSYSGGQQQPMAPVSPVSVESQQGPRKASSASSTHSDLSQQSRRSSAGKSHLLFQLLHSWPLVSKLFQ